MFLVILGYYEVLNTNSHLLYLLVSRLIRKQSGRMNKSISWKLSRLRKIRFL